MFQGILSRKSRLPQKEDNFNVLIMIEILTSILGFLEKFD